MVRPKLVKPGLLPGTLEVVVACKGGCDRDKTITVPESGYLSWIAGNLIQRAMPGVTLDARELLISGTCGECFDKLFPPEAPDCPKCGREMVRARDYQEKANQWGPVGWMPQCWPCAQGKG